MTVRIPKDIRDSIIVITGAGITALISMVYAVYAGRLLGPHEAADFYVIIALCMLFVSAAGPVNVTVTKFTAQYAARGTYGSIRALVSFVEKRVHLLGLIFLFSMVLLRQPIAHRLQIRQPVLVVYAGVFVYLSFLIFVFRGALRGMERYGAYAANTVLEAVARLAGGIMLLFFFKTAGAGFLAYSIALGIAFIMVRWHYRWTVPRGTGECSHDDTRVHGFFFWMLATSVCASGLLTLDMTFVKHYLPRTVAGYYGAAQTCARIPNIIFVACNTLLIPRLTRAAERREPLLRPLLAITGIFAVAAGSVIILFYFFSPAIIRLFFGPAFAPAAAIVFPLSAVHVILYSAFLLSAIFVVMHHFRYVIVWGMAVAALIGGYLLFHETWQSFVQVLASCALGLFVVTVGLVIAVVKRKETPQE